MARGEVKKVKIDYKMLTDKIKAAGKTGESFSYELGRSKGFVYSLRKFPEQPEGIEKLMCLLLELEPGSLVDKGCNQADVRVIENIYKAVESTNKKVDALVKQIAHINDSITRLDDIFRKTSANTLQLERIKDVVQEQQKILREFAQQMGIFRRKEYER